MGPSSPPQKKGGTHSSLQFSVHAYCDQTAGWIKMPLGTEVDLVPGDTVLDGDRPPPERGTAAPYTAHVYCGQTTGCIRVPRDARDVVRR